MANLPSPRPNPFAPILSTSFTAQFPGTTLPRSVPIYAGLPRIEASLHKRLLSQICSRAMKTLQRSHLPPSDVRFLTRHINKLLVAYYARDRPHSPRSPRSQTKVTPPPARKAPAPNTPRVHFDLKKTQTKVTNVVYDLNPRFVRPAPTEPSTSSQPLSSVKPEKTAAPHSPTLAPETSPLCLPDAPFVRSAERVRPALQRIRLFLLERSLRYFSPASNHCRGHQHHHDINRCDCKESEEYYVLPSVFAPLRSEYAPLRKLFPGARYVLPPTWHLKIQPQPEEQRTELFTLIASYGKICIDPFAD